MSALASSFEYKKHMKGCINYDILSNYKYAKLFAYAPIELRDTIEEKATSDSLDVIINAAYFPDNKDFTVDRDMVSYRKPIKSFKKNLLKGVALDL